MGCFTPASLMPYIPDILSGSGCVKNSVRDECYFVRGVVNRVLRLDGDGDGDGDDRDPGSGSGLRTAAAGAGCPRTGRAAV